MAGLDIDCVVIGEASGLAETLQSLSEVSYHRGSITTYVVGQPESNVVVERFPDVTFVDDPSEGKNRARARNIGWDVGRGSLVQFIESGDRITGDWFQRATKDLLGGVGAVCGRIEPTNPDVNRWHRIAYLESKTDLEEGRFLDVELLVRREVLEEMGGFNESIPYGGALEFNARLKAKGRQVVHLDFPMCRRAIDIPNWKAYWKWGVASGFRMAAADHKGPDSSLAREAVVRGGGAVILLIVGLLALVSSTLALLFLIPAAIILLKPRIFSAERVATQEGFSPQDAALYTWHRSLFVIPQLWGVVRYTCRRVLG